MEEEGDLLTNKESRRFRRSSAIGVPMGMLYGFGYIFSLPVIKKWGAWAAGVSGSIAFSALLSQLFFRRGLITGLFISMMLLACVVGFAYIPGIYIGIKAIGMNPGNNNLTYKLSMVYLLAPALHFPLYRYGYDCVSVLDI